MHVSLKSRGVRPVLTLVLLSFSPDPRVPPDAGLLAVDVSKVTLPAWPGQGMVAIVYLQDS